jgi:hypothetical protein
VISVPALQAESFFSEAGRAAAASAAYAKHEAALARRVAQLPRPVMSGRSNSSISITIDKRGRVSDDAMAVSVLVCVCVCLVGVCVFLGGGGVGGVVCGQRVQHYQ